jgi:hypothetical protein
VQSIVDRFLERQALNEQELADQLAKTGNLMDLCLDETWVRESAQIESECNGRIEAGQAMQVYAMAKYDDARREERKALYQQMRVQSILFSELRLWMEEWGLGISFEESYTTARQLLREHLKEPTNGLQEWIQALLAEDKQSRSVVEMPIRTQAREKLVDMMTEENWHEIAQVAAQKVAASVLTVGQTAGQIKQQPTVAA